jgi:hypothetical protein
LEFAADVDECQSPDPVCDINANCSNTYGNYFCTCTTGYTGDGSQCNGNVPCKLAFFYYQNLVQISTSVIWDLIAVIQMQLVIILMEATSVYVILDSLEMGPRAQVRVLSRNFCLEWNWTCHFHAQFPPQTILGVT